MNERFYQVGTNQACGNVSITNYRAEGAVGPETHAQLVWLPGEGFELTMWCFEKDPTAVYFHPDVFQILHAFPVCGSPPAALR